MKKEVTLFIIVLVALLVVSFLDSYNITQTNSSDIEIFFTEGNFVQLAKIDENSYESGEKKFEYGYYFTELITIPSGATMLYAISTRDFWLETEKNIIEVQVDIFDGVKWINNYIGYADTGGFPVRGDGTPNTESYVYSELPQGVGRRARLRVKIMKALTTNIALKFL